MKLHNELALAYEFGGGNDAERRGARSDAEHRNEENRSRRRAARPHENLHTHMIL